VARILKFGTAQQPATIWLWPIFRARLPAVKDRLRKVAVVASKGNDFMLSVATRGKNGDKSRFN